MLIIYVGMETGDYTIYDVVKEWGFFIYFLKRYYLRP